ncbi:long-chain fatty acid--CoA ligase [Paenibacillus sp. F411]|uniref:ANL family adenylate-forming protein n=1 Tax=Paenibacillus sp. F411 TaxID=2820239 RepID=UPI001AAF8680|nr:fatty acid--CoA ligase family protein [Paenibacillus sp. F411]MBO2942766.1 long-chain fatty acid--CoA ligase [Paenibacillus sp. F411]
MECEELLQRFARWKERPALVCNDEIYTYGWLLQNIHFIGQQVQMKGMAGSIVTLEEPYSPEAVAALLALWKMNCITAVMDAQLPEAKRIEYAVLTQAAFRCSAGREGLLALEAPGFTVTHPLLLQLQREESGGLIIFSSGSSGASKAAVHRTSALLSKYEREGRALKTIPFMLLDHIGGMNTMLRTLSSGGTLYILKDRSPSEVCRTIEQHRIQALPVSPTFMNLLLMSKTYEAYDLSSLEVVSYGSEVMPPSTLKAWHQAFPGVKTNQAYGMSELGVLPTRSAGSKGLAFSIQSEQVKYRIVDGLLEVKSPWTMMGYLNAPDPFTTDGWLKTGDEALEEEGFIRILGRRSEMINVGGEKVYPAEVEDVLQQLPFVEAAVVSGEASGITGQLIKATLSLREEMKLAELRQRVWEHCRDRLPAYKIPQKIVIAEHSLTGSRMKKLRNL